MAELDFSWIRGNLAVDEAQGEEQQPALSSTGGLVVAFNQGPEDVKQVLDVFKRNCRRHDVLIRVGESSHGFPCVALKGRPGLENFCACLRAVLDIYPRVEAALLVELSRTDDKLFDLLEERAAIRGADGLRDDLESAALSYTYK